MDLRHLHTFEAVANLLNFTRAAEALGYAQSSVTAQIRALEEEVGQPLFDRLGKRVTLTEAGRRFRPYAAKMLEMAQEARQAAQGTGEVRGVVRVGASESLCAFRLPAVLRQLRAEYPGVQVILDAGMCYRIRERLRSGTIDLGLTLEPETTEHDLVVQPLLQERISLIAYPWHRLAASARVYPRDLQDEALIHTEAECPYRQHFTRLLEAENVHPPTVMEFSSIEAIKQCVMAGLGLTVLPRITCEKEIEQGSLVELPWAGPPVPSAVLLTYHKDKWLSPPLRAFLSALHKILVQ